MSFSPTSTHLGGGGSSCNGGASPSPPDLGQIGSQVIGEPAVVGPEGLGLGRLSVPHDAEPIAEGLEGDYLVVPDPEPLPAAGEVDVLGGETQHPGVGVDRLQVVNSLDDPDELLRLHQVEGDGPVHALPRWDDALGDVPEHRGLDEAGLDAVLVQGLLGQGEMVRVPGQGVLLVQGEEAVLEGLQGGRFPSPDEEPVGFTLAQVCLPDGEGQVLEVSVPVLECGRTAVRHTFLLDLSPRVRVVQ